MSVYSVETINPIGVLTIFENNYLEWRDVDEKGKVSASRPLYRETAARIFKAVYNDVVEYRFKSLISENIKYVDNDNQLIIVWTKEAGIETLYHTSKKYEGKYAIPNLCFKIKGKTLHVVAYDKFGIDEPIFYAPFTNVGNSSICMGSASLKISKFEYYEDIIEYAEAQFFNSLFSHSPTDYHKLGRDQEVFLPEWLKPMEKNKAAVTIKNYING